MTHECEVLRESNEIKGALSGFRQILVTGPQRSGTHIVSKMLANDFGLQYVDESRVNAGRWAGMRMALSNPRVSVQCPAFSSEIHHVKSAPSRCVVWVYRNRQEVLDSQDRIGWTRRIEPLEIDSYRRVWGQGALGFDRCYDIKHHVWESRQIPRMNVPVFGIAYGGGYVQEHEMYVPKVLRGNFRHDQTAVNQ